MSAADHHDCNLSFGDVTIDRADERVIGPDGPIKLGRRAFRVLLLLAEREGQLITKDMLFDSVWDGMIVSDSALTSVIKELRRALGDRAVDPRYIQSVYGRGYRLCPAVRRIAPGATGARPRGTGGDIPGPRRMGEAPLLILPAFEDAAVARAHPHLGAALHEEMLIALSRFRDIRLVSDVDIARGDAERFGERDYRLGVKLLGSDDGIRVFARMSRLSTGAIIWADQIGLDPGNPMLGMEAIALRVAGVALPRLRDDLLRDLPPQPDGAYDHYFLTRLRMRDLASLEDALDVTASWEDLIARYPELVQAYPPLIRLYNTDYCFTGPGATGPEQRRRAHELAHRAIGMDSTDSHLNTVKGWCHLWAGEAELARRHFEEAVQLNPYHHARLVELATGFMFLDALDYAAELLDRCRALTAFVSQTPHEEEGLLLLLREDYREAAEALALARRIHPDNRTMARPSLLTELYSVLAAAGAGAPDLADRAQSWRRMIAADWRGADAPDPARIKQWIFFHNPFQAEARRTWLSALVDRALAARPAGPDIAPQARPGTRSVPR